MKFQTFILIVSGITFIGLSIGYVLGFYISKNFSNNNYFYLSVLFMAIGCFTIIYGTLFKERKN